MQIIIGLLYGMWLASFPVVEFFTAPQSEAKSNAGLLMACIVAGAVPVALQAFLYGPPPLGRLRKAIGYIAAFLVINIASSAQSSLLSNWSFVSYPLVLAFSMAVTALMYTERNERMLLLAMGLYGAVACGVMAIVIHDGDFVWGRLYGRANPNYWGLIALSAGLCGFCLRPLALRIGVIGFSMTVLYLASSRGSILAFVGAVLYLAGMSIMAPGGIRVRTLLMGLAGTIVAGSLSFGLAEPAIRFVSDDVLLLNDPYRGVNSGFSGRSEAWELSLNLLAAAPVLGYGYRQHEKLIAAESTVLGAGNSTHNAYLAVLLDT